MGIVPNLVDLTTDEFSFVIKCTASRHLPVRRKTPPPCRGGGSKSRRGFPPTCHSARGTRRPLWPPQGKQKGRYDPARRTKGHYGRRKGNKRVVTTPQGEQKGIMAAERRTEGALRPVGVRPPPPLRGSSPCKAGQFIPAGFDCRHSGPVETETCAIQLPQFIFPFVLNPPKCELFQEMPPAHILPLTQ